MHGTLLKALMAFVPVCILFAWSLISFLQGQALCSLLQLLGAGCLVVVVLTHLCEAWHLLPFMHWGSPSGMGHALDLWSAVLGLTLCPLGYLWTRVTRKQTTSSQPSRRCTVNVRMGLASSEDTLVTT
jgi:hypothetical protein